MHTILDEIRIGAKVLIAHGPDSTATIRVTNGVVISVNATSVRIAWENNDGPMRETFTEGELCYLAFEQPEPSISYEVYLGGALMETLHGVSPSIEKDDISSAILDGLG